MTGLGAAVAALAVPMGCAGAGAGASNRPAGLAPAGVCGGFAQDTAASAALTAALGSERLTDDRSEPEKALDLLRDATAAPLADSYRPQPVPYCALLPAQGGRDGLTVEVNPIAKAPGMHGSCCSTNRPSTPPADWPTRPDGPARATGPCYSPNTGSATIRPPRAMKMRLASLASW
ncbi:hypothetical protein ABZT27_04855 [Streptomyces sp. NPDC005389]|uniref:hypothetical protein n=1 Tax=Streptomyces sp. NPDC005389 TaxID=3157040 RepID=UPI00339DA967